MDTLPLLYALLVALVVIALSAVGLITTFPKIRTVVEKHLGLLSSFSAGVFLMIGIMLIEEIFEEGIDLTLIASIVFGALASFALSFVPEYHHHHYEKDTPHRHSKRSAARILFSDGLHNMGDGILLAIAFTASIPLGIATSVGIVVHETLQEISKFFLLRQSGYSIRSAVKWSLVVSSTVLVGVVLGIFVASISNILLGFAAGSLLTVVFHDLIPSSVQTSKKENRRYQHLAIFVAGSVLMFLLYSLIHSH